MASLKKEVAALISRFDAAQEAFVSNTTDLKKVRKQHKKELKKAKKSISKLEEQVADLQKQLSKTEGKLAKAQAQITEAPVKESKAPKSTGGASTPEASDKGRSQAKTSSRKAKATKAKRQPTGRKGGRGPGRPRTKPAVPDLPMQAVKGVGPAVARAFDAEGVKQPSQVAEMSDDQIRDIFNKIGRRYNNPTPEKIKAFRDAAAAAGDSSVGSDASESTPSKAKSASGASKAKVSSSTGEAKAANGSSISTAKSTAASKEDAPKKKSGPGRPRTKPVVEKHPLEAISGVGPAVAKAMDAKGIKTPGDVANTSDDQLRDIFNGIGRRYNNPTDEKLQSFRDAATAATTAG